jgi:hypothetical protein
MRANSARGSQGNARFKGKMFVLQSRKAELFLSPRGVAGLELATS